MYSSHLRAFQRVFLEISLFFAIEIVERVFRCAQLAGEWRWRRGQMFAEDSQASTLVEHRHQPTQTQNGLLRQKEKETLHCLFCLFSSLKVSMSVTDITSTVDRKEKSQQCFLRRDPAALAAGSAPRCN